MRLIAHIFSLLLPAAAMAGTVMVSSDESRHGKQAEIPEIVIRELQNAGLQKQGGDPESRLGISSLRVTKVDCRSSIDPATHSETAVCKMEGEDGRGHHALRLEKAADLARALHELADATDNLDIMECDSNDDCRIRVRSILCMVNEGMKAGAPGRSNCSFGD